MEHTVRIDALGNMFIDDIRLPNARKEWYVDGHTFYLRGSFAGSRYEKAANLVICWCQQRHINTFNLRRIAGE